MEPIDLTGLDQQSAREIVVQVIKSLKQTSAQRTKVAGELEMWRKRVSLAAEHGKSDLQAQAQTRVDDLTFQLEGLQAEEHELIRTVDRLKRQLRDMEQEPRLSVDTDALLTQLEILGGERDELSDAFRETEADALLEKLKQEMNEDT